MRRTAIPLTILGAILGCVLYALPAHAQATRTWVSGVGDDANPCSRTAPCKTFAGAISKTAAGGEINCLDPGGFGGVTITKSITIACEGVTAGVLVSGTNAIIVNAAATDTVVLRGLDFEGLGTGLNGVRFLAGANLVVDNCVIRNFRGATPNGFGIQFVPNATSKLTVLNTTLINNGTGATGGGIQIRPTGGTTTALITNVTMSRNVFGLAVDGGGGAAAINATVRDSGFSGNTSAGILSTSTNPANVLVDHTSSVNNGTGIQASGVGGVVRVNQSVITGNTTGVNGANVLSFLNNVLIANGTDGTMGAVPGGLK